MRKTSLAAALAAVVSLCTFFQLACQPAGTNRSEPLAQNTNSERGPIDTASIEAELLRIENDWPRVIKEKDVVAVGRVEADDIVIVYPDGNVGTKQNDLNDIAGGALTADDINMADLKVRVLDSDAAIVSGQTEIKNGMYKMPDGTSRDVSGKYRFIDTFARRNGEWKLVAGISTRITATAAATASPVAAASPAVRASPAASPTLRAPTTPRSSPAVRASPAASPTVRRAPTPRSSPAVTATP